MRLRLAVVSAAVTAFLAAGTAVAGPSGVEIVQTGTITGDGSGRIQVNVVGTGDDGILGNVPWLVEVSVGGTALKAGDQGEQYVDGTNKKSGYITFVKSEFTPKSGMTYSITVKVLTKSGNKPMTSAQVKFQ